MTKLLEMVFPNGSAARFLECHALRRYMHLSGEPAARFDTILTVADLDRLFQSEQLPAGFFNVVTAGKWHPIEHWSRVGEAARGHARFAVPELLFDFYRQGATLIVNKAHQSMPSVGEACRRLSQELGFAVGANIYITPPKSQGTTRHKDDHDVLILQISGSKSWIVWDGDAGVELTMRPGDVLFLPRYLHHEAKCEDSGSVHATLGLNPIYLFQLVEELAAVAAEHPDFQDVTPLPEGSADEFEVDFGRRLHALLSEATVAGLIGRRSGSFVNNQRQGWPGRFQDLLQIELISADSVVQARPGIVTQVVDQGGMLNVTFADKSVTIPRFLAASLDQILTGARFQIRELEGLVTEKGKVDLLKPLIQSGLVSIVRI